MSGGAKGLARMLGLGDLLWIVVGSVIGSGIFLVPAPVLRHSGGHVASAVLVWVVGGVLSVLGALAYGELGASNPEAGGLYVYIRDAFGSLWAFVYGWTLFFMIGTGSVATLAVAFAAYARQIVSLPASAGPIVAAVMILSIAALNVLGTRRAADVQNVATVIKVGAIVSMSVWLLVAGSGSAAGLAWSAPHTAPASLSGLGMAMVAVLWAYEGWQYVTFSAGEAVRPQHTFPRGIVFGTAITMVVYIVANLAYLAALGPARAAASDRIAADAVAAVVGPAAGRLVAGAILISIFSAANAITLTESRVFYAMARDGVFFKGLAAIHPRFGTPALAVASSSLWAVLLAATGTFEQLFTYVVFAGWIFYGLGAAALLVDRRRRPLAQRPFRTPGYPWTPVAFIASALAIVASTLVTQPGRAGVGLLIVATAVPAYWIWRRPGRPIEPRVGVEGSQS